VAAYVSKYISDEGSLIDLPNGVRRFSTSRGLSLFERSKPADGWQLAKLPIERLRSRCGIVESETFDDTGQLVLFTTGNLAYIYEARWHKTSRWKEIVWTLRTRGDQEGTL
jgi:hypothetical protein